MDENLADYNEAELELLAGKEKTMTDEGPAQPERAQTRDCGARWLGDADARRRGKRTVCPKGSGTRDVLR